MSETNRRYSRQWKTDQHYLEMRAEARRKRQVLCDARAFGRLTIALDCLLGIRHAAKNSGIGGFRAWQRRLEGVDFLANAEKLRGLSEDEMILVTKLSRRSLVLFLRRLGKSDILLFSNHKVKCIRFVELDKPEPVYDLSVEGEPNFGLDAGVFVHNSDDTTDACAGAYFDAINSEERTALLTEAVPSIYAPGALEAAQRQDPMEGYALPLPARTYRTVKVHRLK
jgi:hypothetical protein